MPFEKSVGAVIFRREKNKIIYLLLQHPGNKGREGQWAFPKGHVEKGETWEDTLRREVKEETGITKIKIISDFYAWQKYFYRARGDEKKRRKKKKEGLNIFKIVTFYPAETKAKKVKLSFEHEDYVWLEYEKALARITYGSTKNILKKTHQYIASHYAKRHRAVNRISAAGAQKKSQGGIGHKLRRLRRTR